MQHHILVAGAGIGGLVAALELHAGGHDVQVFEAVAELQALGVGINLLPHAAALLDRLGLLDRLLEAGIATRELVYVNKFGQRIWSEPRGRFAGHAAPQVSLARGVLHMALLAACRERLGAGRVLCGHRLATFETSKDKVILHFVAPDGSVRVVEGDVLVAADGIHSRARAQLYPAEGPPLYSGRILWRATSFVPPFLTGSSMVMAGHQDQKFVVYPIEPLRADGLQRINWIAELRLPSNLKREDWNRSGQLSDFLPQFESWQFGWLDVPGVIRAAHAVFEYPMVDRDPLARWSHDRMTLLGDAAHPMYPIGSNGASQAILDAGALAGAFAAQPDPVAALAAYEAERRPATTAIVKANRGNGPEQCLQIVEERAPNGFARIEDVVAPGELEAITAGYKVLTGMPLQPENTLT